MPSKRVIQVPAFARRIEGLDDVAAQLEREAQKHGREILDERIIATTQVGWRQYIGAPAVKAAAPEARLPLQARENMEQIAAGRRLIMPPNQNTGLLKNLQIFRGAGGKSQSGVSAVVYDASDASGKYGYFLHDDRNGIRGKLGLDMQDQPWDIDENGRPFRTVQVLRLAGQASANVLAGTVGELNRQIDRGKVPVTIGELAVITTHTSV
jgi:hypothetical protein